MEPDTRSAVLGHSANFAELKAKVSIEQVLSMLELSLKKQGPGRTRPQIQDRWREAMHDTRTPHA